MDPQKTNQSRNILLGKYEMGRILGKGTFGKVYYGKSLSNGENVAVKVINKDQVQKQGLVEQIQREISVMHLAKHPNVVELKEVMATKKHIFFVMEYVRGGELFSKIVKGKFKEDYARKYFQQLISAIDFVHSRGISHRDLKPENLLLDENGNLKISDFGLSSLPEQLWNDGLLHTQCGTPAYIAPEVLRKRGYDGAKSDIWSCGVILYVLLAGYLPFEHENLSKLYRQIFKAEFQFPTWFSPESKRLISKLLVVDPNRRLNVSAIMRNSWFRKGICKPNSISIEESSAMESEATVSKSESKSKPPRFYNAFEFISSMSSGFDLSNLFEDKRKSGSTFTSRCSAAAIMVKLEAVGKKLNFRVFKVKDFKVKLQGMVDGRKGKLGVTAEIYEVAPELVTVVELNKADGDSLEYYKFCEEDVRPAIKDIVWSWQGENNNINK